MMATIRNHEKCCGKIGAYPTASKPGWAGYCKKCGCAWIISPEKAKTLKEKSE